MLFGLPLIIKARYNLSASINRVQNYIKSRATIKIKRFFSQICKTLAVLFSIFLPENFAE